MGGATPPDGVVEIVVMYMYTYSCIITGIGRWFELGGDNNDPCKNKYFAFILLQTCFRNFQLNQKSRGRPLAPLLPTPMIKSPFLYFTKIYIIPSGWWW